MFWSFHERLIILSQYFASLLTMAELWQLNATDIQAKVANGEITIEEYVKSLLKRIEERDPVVQAWAYLNPDYALSEARRLDQIPPAERGPLHGMVIGVKDVILTKGNDRYSLVTIKR